LGHLAFGILAIFEPMRRCLVAPDLLMIVSATRPDFVLRAWSSPWRPATARWSRLGLDWGLIIGFFAHNENQRPRAQEPRKSQRIFSSRQPGQHFVSNI
jgi:hypothetical protein